MSIKLMRPLPGIESSINLSHISSVVNAARDFLANSRYFWPCLWPQWIATQLGSCRKILVEMSVLYTVPKQQTLKMTTMLRREIPGGIQAMV